MDTRRHFLKAATVSAFAAALPASAEAPNQPPSSGPTYNALFSNSVASISGTPGELGDRVVLRRLVDAWAHCADRRLAAEQAALFTPDGVLNNYLGDPATHAPQSTLRGHAEIQKALAVLNTFTITFHMNGQSAFFLEGYLSHHRGFGETYCMAHQVTTAASGERTLQTLYIRYTDTFVKKEDQWFFQERNLIIDISDTRPTVA
jgi:hypothetical protein